MRKIRATACAYCVSPEPALVTRFRYRRDLDMLLRVLQSEADAAGRVDWSASVDCSMVRASALGHRQTCFLGRIVRGSKTTAGLD